MVEAVPLYSLCIALLWSAVGEWLTLSSEARVGLQAGPGCGVVVVKDVFSLRRAEIARAVVCTCEQCLLKENWYLKRKIVSIILENTL